MVPSVTDRMREEDVKAFAITEINEPNRIAITNGIRNAIYFTVPYSSISPPLY